MRLIFSLIMVCAAAWGQGTRTKLPNEQWVKLFNGHDLGGWIEVGHEKWFVEDSSIHGEAVTKEYGYLKTGRSRVEITHGDLVRTSRTGLRIRKDHGIRPI